MNMSEIKYNNIFMKSQKLIVYDKNNSKLFKLINKILKMDKIYSKAHFSIIDKIILKKEKK